MTIAEQVDPIFEVCSECGEQRPWVRHELDVRVVNGHLALHCPCGQQWPLEDRTKVDAIFELVKAHRG
jgi:hypothetical protein